MSAAAAISSAAAVSFAAAAAPTSSPVFLAPSLGNCPELPSKLPELSMKVPMREQSGATGAVTPAAYPIQPASCTSASASLLNRLPHTSHSNTSTFTVDGATVDGVTVGAATVGAATVGTASIDDATLCSSCTACCDAAAICFLWCALSEHSLSAC